MGIECNHNSTESFWCSFAFEAKPAAEEITARLYGFVDNQILFFKQHSFFLILFGGEGGGYVIYSLQGNSHHLT